MQRIQVAVELWPPMFVISANEVLGNGHIRVPELVNPDSRSTRS